MKPITIKVENWNQVKVIREYVNRHDNHDVIDDEDEKNYYALLYEARKNDQSIVVMWSYDGLDIYTVGFKDRFMTFQEFFENYISKEAIVSPVVLHSIEVFRQRFSENSDMDVVIDWENNPFKMFQSIEKYSYRKAIMNYILGREGYSVVAEEPKYILISTQKDDHGTWYYYNENVVGIASKTTNKNEAKEFNSRKEADYYRTPVWNVVEA